jgi:hypothetical protein
MGLIEQPESAKVGIACSGGGVRSAAFNLGALQALQSEGVLASSRYLAGVSGGSYIAAAFCMVRKTWKRGEEPPLHGNDGWDDSDPTVVNADHPPFFPGSPEEEYLRNRSSYLAPGLFGKIQLGYRVLLGLAFNLGFIGFTLAAVAVPLAALYGWLYPSLDKSLSQCPHRDCGFSAWPPPSGLWIPIAALAGLALVLGIGSMVAFRWAPWLRDLTATWSLRLLGLAVGGAALLMGVPLLLTLVRSLAEPVAKPGPVVAATATEPGKPAVLIGAGSVATVGAGVFLQLRADWLEVRKLAKQVARVDKWYTGLGQRLRRVLAYLIATLAGPALALALMLVVMSAILNLEQTYVRWIWFGGFAVGFAIVYAFADLTTWSLHPFYRRRLATAFALKRVRRPPQMPANAAEEVGIAVERDYDKLVPLSKTAIERNAEGRCQWPTLLVCAAANVSDNAATPPGRDVTSFTFSATAMGGPLIGAVKTLELEERCDRHRLSYFTLPAAVAMSGAALAPSMGKMTRRPLRMLMGFANIRLGVWVPNPRRLEKFTQGSFYPRPRPSYLLRELLGINPINANFLYVTDGGHYENLGVMELLRRGCTAIYCFDASNDHFDALGDLVSLARSELDVEVNIDVSPLKPNDAGLSAQNCVVGTVTFPGKGAPSGRLYYSRPVIAREASADVVAYHTRDPRFPHDPTGDQLYTDQRFEAYRALGVQAARSAIATHREHAVAIDATRDLRAK